MFDTPNMEGGKKKSKKRGNDEGGYSYDSFSKKGGAKGKPGKRSRMANHDNRDLDGFRDERRGGGRVRKSLQELICASSSAVMISSV